MPVRSYDTQDAPSLQLFGLLEDAWEQEVVSRLPVDLARQAQILGAFQRKRGLQSPSDLLRGLLAYALGVLSFRRMGAWAVVIALGDISESAWRKHLHQAQPWLVWLLGQRLAALEASSPSFPQARGRILLIDATRLGHPGGAGDDWRLHVAYDLLAGRLSQVTIGDYHSGEHLQHYALKPGDIGVADGVYGYRRSVALAQAQGADVLLRITLSSFPLETETGAPFDLVAWLKHGRRHQRETRLYCRYDKQRYRVRLIAVKLPPEKAELARKRLLASASKHRFQVRAETLMLAEWVLLVTTLHEATWPRSEVLRLYRARWQIELVFKRMKQLLRLNTLRVKERTAVEAVICLQLIAWTLQEDEVSWIRQNLPHRQEKEPVPASTWRLTALCLSTVCQAVLGHWTQQQVRSCLTRLQRFLCGSPRKRKQQETLMRQRWLQRFPKPDEPTYCCLSAAA